MKEGGSVRSEGEREREWYMSESERLSEVRCIQAGDLMHRIESFRSPWVGTCLEPLVPRSSFPVSSRTPTCKWNSQRSPV